MARSSQAWRAMRSSGPCRRLVPAFLALCLAACGGLEGEEDWLDHEDPFGELTAAYEPDAGFAEERPEPGTEARPAPWSPDYLTGPSKAVTNPLQAVGDSSPDPIPARVPARHTDSRAEEKEKKTDAEARGSQSGSTLR